MKQLIEQLKKMTFKEALDHLWTYYRWRVIIITACIVMAVSIASTVIDNSRTHPVLNVGVLADMNILYGDEITGLLKGAFPETTKYTAPVISEVSSPTSSDDMYASLQLAARITSGDIEALIGDQTCVDYISRTGEGITTVDISDTALGKKAAELGINPLLYMYFTDFPHADNSARLLEAIQKQP